MASDQDAIYSSLKCSATQLKCLPSVLRQHVLFFLSGFQITSPGEHRPDRINCRWCSVAQFQSPANYPKGVEQVMSCTWCYSKS